jgi:hypothetical protein
VEEDELDEEADEVEGGGMDMVVDVVILLVTLNVVVA